MPYIDLHPWRAMTRSSAMCTYQQLQRDDQRQAIRFIFHNTKKPGFNSGLLISFALNFLHRGNTLFSPA